ncbi:MAG TPA: RNA polymerase sigma factor [Bacteroidales bacterium]|nr:RNA polymerase sigma factor [Bacteroidales bacterium]HQQ11693.1 RNA polymerase sigma factor [Bacteroidales bacterium]
MDQIRNSLSTSRDYSALDEQMLVLEVRKGNEAAMEEIVNRNKKAVATVLKAILGDTQEAEDVGQETFIRFWCNIESYRHEARVSTYLTRIAINLAINEGRRQKRRTTILHSINNRQLNGNSDVYLSEAQRYDDVSHLQVALSRLDDDQRMVVVLRMLQGYSTKETSKLLNIPTGTVLSRLSRALDKLKVILLKLEKV